MATLHNNWHKPGCGDSCMTMEAVSAHNHYPQLPLLHCSLLPKQTSLWMPLDSVKTWCHPQGNVGNMIQWLVPPRFAENERFPAGAHFWCCCSFRNLALTLSLSEVEALLALGMDVGGRSRKGVCGVTSTQLFHKWEWTGIRAAGAAGRWSLVLQPIVLDWQWILIWGEEKKTLQATEKAKWL